MITTKFTRRIAGLIVAGALACGVPTAQAALICAGCEFQDDPGTYLGLYNPATFDVGTFQHSDVGTDAGASSGFTDFWVFDLEPGGTGSVSADFTTFASISDFTGALFADAGSVCAGNQCSSVLTGALLGTANSVNDRWEAVADLPAGRYVLRVTGTTNARATSAYTGQLAFLEAPVGVPEPGAAALLGLGLLTLGLARRRQLA
jgi:hypothetical protein